MLHIAMFDAVNAIEDAYTPYRVQVRASHGASPEAAAAQAAHDVLTAIFPTQQATFDALLASQLAGLPPGRVKQGVAIGRAVARAILEWRQNDGWPPTIAPDPTYVLPLTPGNWQPTPPGSASPRSRSFRTWRLWDSDQHPVSAAAPPALTSERYAEDFNETKSLGSATSDVRTAEQTEIALRIAAVGFSTVTGRAVFQSCRGCGADARLVPRRHRPPLRVCERCGTRRVADILYQ